MYTICPAPMTPSFLISAAACLEVLTLKQRFAGVALSRNTLERAVLDAIEAIVVRLEKEMSNQK